MAGITVITKDDKTHEYPTAEAAFPNLLLGCVIVSRMIDKDTPELLAWFPTADVLKVEFFVRAATGAASNVDGMPVN